MSVLNLCSIASGSSGNCICVGGGSTHVLIDAGISGKRIEEGLKAMDLCGKDVQGILITHEHIDHIAGLGVLARRYHLPIYTTAGTRDGILRNRSVGRIDEQLFHVIIPGQVFSIGDLQIKALPVSHDAAEPVAYRLFGYGKSVAVITDLGIYDQSLIDELQGLDALLLEANHDVKMLQTGSYPYPLKQRILGSRGHLSNESSGQLLCAILHDNLKAIMLGHLSKENNYPDLAYEAVRMEITMGDNPYKAENFQISVANRDTVSKIISV